jgi:hypothetical protein
VKGEFFNENVIHDGVLKNIDAIYDNKFGKWECGNVTIKVKFEQHKYSVQQQFQKYIKAQTWQILGRKICFSGGILKLKV